MLIGNDQNLNPPLSSDSILNRPEGELAPILKTIQRLKRLNDLLMDILPKDMAKHCQVANFSQGKLTLAFDNASWAGKFHFEKMDYLSKFRAVPDFAGIIHLQHLVDPALFVAPPKKVKPVTTPTFSEATADSLQQLILSSEGKLRKNLEKLQKRIRPPTD
jgi:hypothetical protein